ncbi:MAG: hypothetical protein A3E84_02715 [Gammaproteobacteria bacterium RIFCSPHIGHO2_12_FULL_42_13]|nr:MAG: hypothetical protein A3E84_02715 [Gammaproteobacteria bacterium RIFCSPHIGHO2_12_FULL_42_13]
MDWTYFHTLLLVIQHGISLVGILIILSGALQAIYRYGQYLLWPSAREVISINTIRLGLGRILVLGLEFIVAADLIGTTTTPDYYSVGIAAIVVTIRTVLSYTLNRELATLSRDG